MKELRLPETSREGKKESAAQESFPLMLEKRNYLLGNHGISTLVFFL